MMKYQEVLNTVLSEKISLESEVLDLAEAGGRFLSSRILSPIDSPPFDKAAMDGYAIPKGDERKSYRIRSVSAAGSRPETQELKAGEAVKIMTGAPLPPGSGKIIRVEYSSMKGDKVTIIKDEPYLNIIRKGSNIRAGEPLLYPRRLTAKDIGCLAAAGIAEVNVYKRIRIGTIITGNELREPGMSLKPGQIYNSNGPQLHRQIIESGAEHISYGIVSDRPEELEDAVRRALGECDILLLSGGVSKGDFDFVPQTLESAGVNVIFHRIKVKPGRPTLFGRNKKSLVFGLPGNPVSAFVQFEILIRPLIDSLNSVEYSQRMIRGRITDKIERQDVEITEILPARKKFEKNGLKLTPLRYEGSSHLNALSDADALIIVSNEKKSLRIGDWVDALII